MTKIALIHAVLPAMAPVEEAFKTLWPETRRTNLLDDSLSADREAAGRLTPEMSARIMALAAYAAGTGADAVLFTCSAFGEAIDAAARAQAIPVLKPNEAMFESAFDAGACDRHAGDLRARGVVDGGRIPRHGAPARIGGDARNAAGAWRPRGARRGRHCRTRPPRRRRRVEIGALRRDIAGSLLDGDRPRTSAGQSPLSSPCGAQQRCAEAQINLEEPRPALAQRLKIVANLAPSQGNSPREPTPLHRGAARFAKAQRGGAKLARKALWKTESATTHRRLE